MKRKNTLADLMKAAPDPLLPARPGTSPGAGAPQAGGSLGAPVASGALRAMGLSLEKLSADAEKTRDLEAMIAAGDRVVELDPEQVDGSFVRDRIGEGEGDDASFESLLRSIAEQGQQVPILVRPAATGRYQVAYGHRRLRAVARLGGRVRAIVRPMSDTELVIAQARENLERRDLSYIEKAMFARRLEEKFDRRTLMAALGVDKADLSRLLTLAVTLPEDVVQAIGPAPRVGRPRWSRLATKLAEPDALKRFMALAATSDFRTAATDTRFNMALEALATDPLPTVEVAHVINSPLGGEPLARVEPGRNGGRVVFASEEFGAFVRESLPGLARKFAETRRQGERDQ